MCGYYLFLYESKGLQIYFMEKINKINTVTVGVFIAVC